MEISLKNLYGDIGAKRFNDLYQFADSTKNVSRATANSTCQVPLHVPCAKKGEERFFPAHRFPDIFYLEPNYCMLAIITRVVVGTTGKSREILTLFHIKKYHFRPGL